MNLETWENLEGMNLDEMWDLREWKGLGKIRSWKIVIGLSIRAKTI